MSGAVGWTGSEKRHARRLFDAALTAELEQTVAECKRRAAAISTPDEMWDLEDFLRRHRLEIDRKYDYRYSQLVFVFGILLREGRIQEADLSVFSEDKVATMRLLASL